MNELLMVNIETNAEYAIQTAADIYSKGKVFVYPTDTVYGFGGDPFNKNCINSLNMAKQRADNKQYILFIDSIEKLFLYTDVSEEQKDFAEKLWPNPVTAVLNLKDEYKELFGSGTAAFRIPDNEFCQALLKKIDKPLISTSVNRAGKKPMNDAAAIFKEFRNEIDAVFYTKRPLIGTVSTIIDLSKNDIGLIREGAVAFNYLKDLFNSKS